MAYPFSVQAANDVLRAAEELADAVRHGEVTLAWSQRIDAAQQKVVRTVCLYRIAVSAEHEQGPDIDAEPPDLYACPRGGVEIVTVADPPNGRDLLAGWGTLVPTPRDRPD